MIEIHPLTYIFLLEALIISTTASLSILVISVMRRSAARKTLGQYLNLMAISVENKAQNRLQLLECQTSVEKKEACTQLINQEKAVEAQLYELVGDIFFRKKPNQLNQFPEMLQNYLDESQAVSELLMNETRLEVPQSEPEKVTIDTLKTRNTQLEEKLKSTTEHVDKMLHEFSSMFGGDFELDKQDRIAIRTMLEKLSRKHAKSQDAPSTPIKKAH